MPIRAVTIDFHNTIARCDRWFALEVRDIVPEVLRLLAERGEFVAPDGSAEQARLTYRALREGIIASGEERDVLDCTLATLQTLDLNPDEAAVAAAIETLMREALPGARPEPGIVAAIEALRARDLSLGVVSSAVHHPFLDWTLERFGVTGAFDTIITSASCGYYKTRPEIYHAALRDLGVAATDTIHVGDSYRFDVQGAHRAGLRAIWYASTEAAMNQPDNEADATVSDLATLPAVIATLNGIEAPQRRWWRR
jgi:HAD superfamily hydrolase (TIGR01509 family)